MSTVCGKALFSLFIDSGFRGARVRGNGRTICLLGLFILVSTVYSAYAFLPNTGYWRPQKPLLKITTGAQSIFVSNCSGAVTVQASSAWGTAANVGSNLTVNLSGPGTLTFYSDSSCTNSVTSVTVASGSSSKTFYFIDTAAETASITASATAYASATQSETLSTNPYIWTGGGADANWTTAANWSGGAAPASGQFALFNGSCSSNCSPTVNSAINIGGIRMATGYAGTITQSAGITLGSGGWVQQAGTFTGGSATITISSRFTVVGGTFQSTSGTLTVNIPWSTNEALLVSSPGVFSHNSGTLAVTGYPAGITFPATTDLNNFTIGDASAGAGVTITGTRDILGTLTINLATNSAHFIASLNAKKDLVLNGGNTANGALITLNGGAGVTQTISGTASGIIPPLTINSAGTVVFNTSGTPVMQGPFTYVSGTVTWTNPTIHFQGIVTTPYTTITSNGLHFQNVTFSVNNGAYLQLADTMTINGNLTAIDPTSCNICRGIQGGAIDIKGNFNSSAHWANYGSGAPQAIKSSITFSGTSSQTWTETGSNYYSSTITVSNAAGVVMAAGSAVPILPGGSISTVLSTGNLDLAGGTLNTTSLSLNSNTLTKNGGILKVGGTTVGTGSLYGGTVAP